jgi:hypothetical protein
MAVVYYPNDQLLYSKDTAQGNYQNLVLASSPNVVLYFGTASTVSSASAMDLTITCSWARTASLVFSSSFSTTASYSLNGGGGGSSVSASWASSSVSSSYSLSASYAPGGATSTYVTLTTSSLNWITCSFLDSKEFLLFTTSASYRFTHSNVPANGTYANVSLYISNSSTIGTSSLSFPSNWVWIGLTPSYLTSSKSAYLNLEAFGTNIVASFGTQY